MSILHVMVTPLVVGLPEAPSSYPAPPLPELPDDNPDPITRISPLREVAESPSLDVFPLYLESPSSSAYEPVTSPITPSLREDDVYRAPSSPATMDQYLSRDGDLLLGDLTDFPLLMMSLTPRPFVEEMGLGSSVGSPAGEPCMLLPRPHMECRIYLGRAPLMFIRTLRSRGPLRKCKTVCRATNIG